MEGWGVAKGPIDKILVDCLFTTAIPTDRQQ